LVGVEALAAIVGSQSPAALVACNAAAAEAGVPYLSIAESSGETCAANLYQIAPLPNQREDAEVTAGELRQASGDALTVSDYFEGVQLPANERFLAGLRARDSAARVPPEAARAYDAVHLLAAAVEAAGTTRRADVLSTLPGAKVDGPRGPVSFPPGVHFATLNLFIGPTAADGPIEPVSFRPTVVPKPACR
jgi:ABC-type branched-subunit amino acid transport system substrate-binding protein